MIRLAVLTTCLLSLLAGLNTVQAAGYLETPPNNQTNPSSPPFPPGVQTNDIVFQSFTVRTHPAGSGRAAWLVGRFRFNRWPTGATSMYCAMRNYNASQGAGVALINRKTGARPKLGKDIKLQEDETPDRIQWVFKGDQKEAYVGKTYQFSAKIRVNQLTTLDNYLWRFYCETKQDAPFVSWYYFKWWETIDIDIQQKSGGK